MVGHTTWASWLEMVEAVGGPDVFVVVDVPAPGVVVVTPAPDRVVVVLELLAEPHAISKRDRAPRPVEVRMLRRIDALPGLPARRIVHQIGALNVAPRPDRHRQRRSKCRNRPGSRTQNFSIRLT